MADWLFDYKFVVLVIAIGAGLAAVVGCRSNAPSPSTDQPAAAGSPPEQTDHDEAPAANGDAARDEASSADLAPDDRSWQPLEPRATFHGHIELPVDSQIIDDQQSFDALVEHIPKKKVQKKLPADPNDDPILDEPEIDFDTEVVLVVVCRTYYCQIDILGVRLDDHGYVVGVALPGEGEKAKYAARPAGVGNYRAVVVDRFDDEVRLDLEAL